MGDSYTNNIQHKFHVLYALYNSNVYTMAAGSVNRNEVKNCSYDPHVAERGSKHVKKLLK